MSLFSELTTICHGLVRPLVNPRESLRGLVSLPESVRGSRFARLWDAATDAGVGGQGMESMLQDDDPNLLRAYFDGVTEGPGVWKWLHYFEIYHRHFKKFLGHEVTVLEIGVYSGGSLAMWRQYFGHGCRIHGMDIRQECRAYGDSQTTIHIGDQADRDFWRRFREAVPVLDVLIDDGGHRAEQQMVTLEEMLPHLRPGGVYVCEDVHGVGNRFCAFARSLAGQLNAFTPAWSEHELASAPTPFQAAVKSVHFYPFAVVIEKNDAPVRRLVAPKHGTMWQPFSL